MFDSLTDKFDGIFRKIRGTDKLSESNIQDALREVKLALLEADVHFKVVKEFVEAVRRNALGAEVAKGVSPAQQFVSIVHAELEKMLQGAEADKPFEFTPGSGKVILMLGLQGAGKTTFCGKLARMLDKERCKPLLVACDIYRPAAIEQLRTVGRGVNVPVFDMGTDRTPVEIIRNAQKFAREHGRETIIVDTAGRLHIDEVRMDELRAIREEIKPDYTFLVCDAMTGQDAVNSAQTFDREVGIDGVCLTKMDGDARGGAALSIKAVTGRPIVFVGTGEKADDLERFHPERVAQRILGMGDVVSLVEKAQAAITEKDAEDMQQKLATGKFTYDDFMKQMRMIKRMGSLKGLLGMLPGVGSMLKDVDNDVLTSQLGRVEAIICSMTKEERADGDLLSKNPKRRMRVARGAGRPVNEVNEMVNQFEQMRQMMAMMSGGGLGGLFGGGMPNMPMPGPGEMPDPSDPKVQRMLRQHKDFVKDRKAQARFLPKQQLKRRKR